MLGVGEDGPTAASAEAPMRAGQWTRPRAPSAMDQRERDAWAVLATVDGLGPAAFAILLAHYGSARAIVEIAAEPRGARTLADTPPIDSIREFGRPYLPISEAVAEDIVAAVQAGPRLAARIAELGIRIVTLDDAEYPARLRSIHLPPAVLFVFGAPAALARPRACAVVGTRRATDRGRMTATRIATALVAAEATVVSGLALGIDGAAHEATVRASGVTVAVLGSGLGVISPPTHRRLADAIVAHGGAVVSELGPDVAPGPGTFPRRNRLISGLADATIVVEAPASSGALLTAGWSLDQGRGCFIVPGPLDAPMSAGCLSFLREFHGEARVVTGVAQLIADLGYAGTDDEGRRRPVTATLQQLGVTESRVADAVLAGYVTVDELVAVTGLPVAAVLATLTLLERQGLVVGAYGRYRPAGSLLEPVPVPRRR